MLSSSDRTASWKSSPHSSPVPVTAPKWKAGYGFHPLAAWCANTRECLHMLLRPGNAG